MQIQPNRCLQTLRAAFGLAVAAKQIGALPTDGIVRNTERRRGANLSDEEHAQILAICERFKGGAQHSLSKVCGIRFIALTGMRKTEALTLRWDDVDLETGEVRPKTFKNQTRITDGSVPIRHITPQAVAVLREMAEVRCCAFIFPTTPKSGPRRWVALTDVKDLLKKIKDQMGWPADRPLRCHDFRHYFMSKASEMGVALEDIAALVGHTRLESTMHYLHSNQKRQRQAAERMGAAFDAHQG